MSVFEWAQLLFNMAVIVVIITQMRINRYHTRWLGELQAWKKDDEL